MSSPSRRHRPLRASRAVLTRTASPARGATRPPAKRDLEDAVDLWSRMRAPYELARGRIALAELALRDRPPGEAARELRPGALGAPGLAIGPEVERVAALLAPTGADPLSS